MVIVKTKLQKFLRWLTGEVDTEQVTNSAPIVGQYYWVQFYENTEHKLSIATRWVHGGNKIIFSSMDHTENSFYEKVCAWDAEPITRAAK